MTPTELWLRDVSRISKIPVEKLINHCRKRDVVRLRQAVMFVMVHKRKLSTLEVGRQLGGFDHSTVFYGIRALDNLLRRRDPDAPIRRVNAKMEVLDRLSDHIDVKPTNRDLMCFSTHADFGPDQRSQRQAQGRRYVP